MKAIALLNKDGYQETENHLATHPAIHLPYQEDYIIIPVIIKGKREGTNCWTWNGDTKKPTLKPSILIYYEQNKKSHSHITDGIVKYLNDSDHNLKEKELKEIKWQQN